MNCSALLFKGANRLVLQPTIHRGTALSDARTFEPILGCWRAVRIAFVLTALHSTSTPAFTRRASARSLNRQRKLWHRRLGSSNSPTECDQQTGDNPLNSSARHVLSPLLSSEYAISRAFFGVGPLICRGLTK